MAIFGVLNPTNLFFALEAALGVSLIYNRYIHPYKDIPRPFWASITDLWYYSAVRFNKGNDHQLPLHKKYGPFVRIGPNQVQISEPAAIDTIYGPSNVFPKSAWYDTFNSGISPRLGHFEQRDEKVHAVRRRLVAGLYTQASILQFEPCVDRLIALFYERMEEFAASGEEFDMAVWLRKYTFDVVGEIFYGRKGGFGFLRDNIDYNNWCKLMDTMPSIAAAMPYVPKLLQPFVGLAEMILPSTRTGAKGFYDVIKQSNVAVDERIAEREASKEVKERDDLLNRLLDLMNDNPDPKLYWDKRDVVTDIWTIIWAGSDTTAIALSATFYFLHKNPRTLVKLRREIEESFNHGTIKYPLRYMDCSKLPYLHAVIRESMRIHSSLSLGFPRVVPQGGANICGRYFHEGGGVIMNPSAVNFDKKVFGEDSEDFIPKRWTREGKAKADEMERHFLQFGYGPRVCIGKHVTMVEMYMLLPTILRDFEFEGLEGKEWRTEQGWFHQVRGINVKVKRRRERDVGATVEIPEDKWRGK